jgi:hypothetical protein
MNSVKMNIHLLQDKQQLQRDQLGAPYLRDSQALASVIPDTDVGDV